ncbi:MAG: DEAD/DEAH box helicase family protein [Cyanobacteria bacterium P01_E01_bin.42]
MPSNFDFLKPDFPQLFDHASHAEQLAYCAPRASCFYSRFTLEQAVIWLYNSDRYLKLPYDNNLSALIHEQTFQDNLSPGLFPKLRTIQKMGNIAVHRSVAVSPKDSLHLIEELFHFLYWLCRYYGSNGKTLGKLPFNPKLLPQPTDKSTEELTRQQLQDLAARLSQTEEMKRIAEDRQQQTQSELDRLKTEIAALKQQNAALPDLHDYDEANTRKYLIDVLLKEMGWDLTHPDAIEYEVTGMPKSVNPSGKGRIDYVLWDDNGLPLAVVEAKRSRTNVEKGKQQAKLYADCLEAQFNQRPLIFYSNGYRTYLWDDRRYPPREIQGFLRKEELQYLIWQRQNAKPLHLVAIDPNIAGSDRTYQTEAIRRITETFARGGRKALLVMATGTGKTRTAIALTDILMRANRIKRVLFLADRNSLVTQAQRAFNKHLPHAATVNLTREKDIQGANVVLSTYPTILNQINQFEGEGRKIGSGYFDLVIIDEAHRSVYKKYRYLFDYFDSLLVGLTATPRDEVNRDTYQIFDLEQGNPTFAYELEDAIQDGHLVPPKGIDVPFKFLRSGIRYSELSPAEQEEYEERFTDAETGEIPDEINAAALNRWLFNGNTIDQALEILMELGSSVDGGDRLGKTIIFARNHKHAVEIENRFNRNYPHYKGAFARTIDSHDPYAQSLLDDFSDPNKPPAIAISVDMLDTGVELNPQDIKVIEEDLSQLPNGLPTENPLIKRFDLLCLKIQLAILQNRSDFEPLRDKVRDLLHNLEEKRTIPMVKAQLPLIETVQEEEWWSDATPTMVESLRKNLRDLMQFIDRQAETIVYTDFQDELGDLSEIDVPIQQTGFSPYQYRKKVAAYIRANQDHMAIAKLKRNLPLTATDLSALETMLFTTDGLESREKFIEVYPDRAHNLPSFIRSLVGLDREAAKKAFAQYLETQQFDADRIRFVEQIIDKLTQEGVMNPSLLYEPPFTDFHSQGIEGLFSDNDTDNIIAIVRSFNQTVEAKFGA